MVSAFGGRADAQAERSERPFVAKTRSCRRRPFLWTDIDQGPRCPPCILVATMYKFAFNALIAALLLSGCVETKEPETTAIDDTDLFIADLPELTLVRRVIPEKTSKRTGGEYKETTTTSKFGSAGEIATFNCVIKGLRSVLPKIEIVQTEIFWKNIAHPEEKISLAEIFEPPYVNEIYNLNIDYIIIVYHKIAEKMEGGFFIVFSGMYGSEEHEYASELTIDVPNLTALNSSNISAEKQELIGFVTVYPLLVHTRLSSDPCELTGEISAASITNHAHSPSPRVLIIASKTSPYDAVRRSMAVSGKRRKTEQVATPREECDLVFSEAIKIDSSVRHCKEVVWSEEKFARFQRQVPQRKRAWCEPPLVEAMALNAESQLQRASDCVSLGFAVIWRWRCLAAHQGDHSAQNHVGHYYRVGSKPVTKNLVQAYKWYSLAAGNGNERAAELREQISAQMTPAQISEAERLSAEWKPNPTECETSLDASNAR